MEKLSIISIQLLIITLLIASNSFSQTPIRGYVNWNKVYYETQENDIGPKKENIKVNFNQKSGELDTLKIKEYIGNLKSSLDKSIESVNPILAFNEASILQDLKISIQKIIAKKISDENSNPQMEGSIKSTETIQKLTTLADKVDSLQLVFEAINQIQGKPKFKRRFFPARNRQQAILAYALYDDKLLHIGNNFSLFGWGDKGTINAEIVSFLMGPVRFTFNTLVATTKDTTKLENAKLRTWTGNGGNLIFGVHTPFFHLKTKGTFTFVETNIKYATESPIIGTPFKSDTLFYNFNVGLDFHFAAKIPIFGGSSFYIDTRPSWIIGSKSYLDALQTKGNFVMLQSIIGLEIPNVGRIGLTLPVLSSVKNLTNNSLLLTIQAIPQVSKK